MNLGSLGFWELFVIAGLALLLFGPRKLPELARSLSQAVREFRRGLNAASRELQDELRAAGTDPVPEAKPARGVSGSAPEVAAAGRESPEPPPALPDRPDGETHHR